MAQMKAIVSELAPGSIFHPSLCDLGEQHFWTAGAGQVWGREQLPGALRREDGICLRVRRHLDVFV